MLEFNIAQMAKVKLRKITKTGNKKLKTNLKQKKKKSSFITLTKFKVKKDAKGLVEKNSFENDTNRSDEDNEDLQQYHEDSMLDESINSESSNENCDNESLTGEDEAAKHKKDLAKLKQSDPEFYKFLQENDKKLLQFNLSDDEDDSTPVEDIHKLSETLDVASDESDFEVVLIFVKIFL